MVIVGGDAGWKDPTNLIHIVRAANRITHLSVMFALVASTQVTERRSLDRQLASIFALPSCCNPIKALQAKIGRACHPLVIYLAYLRAVEVTKKRREWSLCRRG